MGDLVCRAAQSRSSMTSGHFTSHPARFPLSASAGRCGQGNRWVQHLGPDPVRGVDPRLHDPGDRDVSRSRLSGLGIPSKQALGILPNRPANESGLARHIGFRLVAPACRVVAVHDLGDLRRQPMGPQIAAAEEYVAFCGPDSLPRPSGPEERQRESRILAKAGTCRSQRWILGCRPT